MTPPRRTSYADRIRAGDVDPWVQPDDDPRLSAGARTSATVVADELGTFDVRVRPERARELEAQRTAWLDRAAVLEGAWAVMASRQSATLGGYDRDESAACDDCNWTGKSRRAAAAHHRATGHNCHAHRRENFFYGDPMGSFLRNIGATASDAPDDQQEPT